MLPRSGEDDDKKQQLNTQLMPIKHSICGTTNTHTRESYPTHCAALRVSCPDFVAVIFSFA